MTGSLLLLVAAAGANGLLAGASLDQSIKQIPAGTTVASRHTSHTGRLDFTAPHLHASSPVVETGHDAGRRQRVRLSRFHRAGRPSG